MCFHYSPAKYPESFLGSLINRGTNDSSVNSQNVGFLTILNVLSGCLSQNKTLDKLSVLGTLSRFVTKQKNESLDILAIVSGPEPQRSLFEKF